jgi:acetyl esterase
MPLDPAARALIDAMEGVIPRLHEMADGAEARLRINAAMVDVPLRLWEPQQPLHHVEDRTIDVDGGQIRLRLYRPSADSDLPIVVFFHGGGWVLCDLESHDAIARRIATSSGCLVVATEYRRSPEFRFPVPVEDCYATLLWSAANATSIGGDATRMAVCGDSAGGNLAAAVAQMTRDRRGPTLRLQVLVYPVIDAACDTESHRTMGHDSNLWTEEVRWCWEQYLATPADRLHPYASPNHAASLSGLAPALVITPELDPLRDEGEAYARALRASGVPVTATRYDGMVHSMLSFSAVLPAAEGAYQQIADALRSAMR